MTAKNIKIWLIVILILIVGTSSLLLIVNKNKLEIKVFEENINEIKAGERTGGSLANINRGNEHGAYFNDINLGNGKRLLQVSPNVINVYEDDTWKKVEDARSLNNSDLRFEVIEQDIKYSYNIIDFNATSIKIVPILTRSTDLNRNVSVKVNGITRTRFNYNDLTNRNQIILYADVLNSNFTIGDNSTTIQILKTGENSLQWDGAGSDWQGARNAGNATGNNDDSIFGWIEANGMMRRSIMNFSLASLPAGVTVLNATFEFKQGSDIPAVTTYIVLRNVTDPTCSNNSLSCYSKFEGWANANQQYIGQNLTLINLDASTIILNSWVNLTFNSEGLSRIQQANGMNIDEFKFMMLDSWQVSQTGDFTGGSRLGSVLNNKFLFIEYEVPIGTFINFTQGYPQINATDGLNSTLKNLTAYFVGTTNSANEVMNYSILWIKNNITQFTYGVIPYTNGTLESQILNSGNLTVNATWKAQINFCGNSTGCIYGNTTELLIINSPPTAPTLIFPLDNFTTADYTVNMSANGSIDNEGDTINYEFYLEREVNPPTILFGNTTAQSNITSLGQDGQYYWRARVNDGQRVSGFSDTRSFFVNRKLITNYSQQINLTSFESINETIISTIMINPYMVNDVNATIVNASQGLILTTARTKINDTTFSFTGYRVTPATDTQYYWNYTLNLLNETRAYNTSYQFTISSSVQSLYDCSIAGSNSSSMVIYNFTLKNEVNETIINGDWQGSFIRYFSIRKTNNTFNFGTKSNITNVLICSSPATASFFLDGIINYNGINIGQGIFMQDPRQYYLVGESAGATIGQQNISLYLLDFVQANAVTFTVEDTSAIGIQNAILKIFRKNIGNNSYNLVAMGKTDNLGNTIIFVRQNDVIYKAVVLFPNGETIDFGDAIFSAGAHTYTSTLGNPLTQLNDFSGVATTITFDNTSKTFTATFFDSKGIISSGCYEVTKINSNGNISVIYNICKLGTSGIFNVYVGNDSATYYTALYGNGSPQNIWQKFEQVVNNILAEFDLGSDGIFYAFIVTLTLIGLGLWKPEVAVAMSLLGVIISAMAGLWAISLTTLVAFLISGALLIWRINKR